MATTDVPVLAAEEEVHVKKVVQLPSGLSAGRYYVWLSVDVTSQAGQPFADEKNDKTHEGIGVDE